MKTYLAAVVQMNSQPDFEYNLEQAYLLIRKAVDKGALFVGIPENFTFLGDFHARLDQSEEIGRRAPVFLEDTAREFGIYLLGGSYSVPAGNGKVFNRSLLVSPEGKILAQYDKIHLFDVKLSKGESYKESEYVEAGKTEPITCITDEIGNIGMSICYDLRFPELYRKLIDHQAELLCVPSAFTATTGRDHWTSLLRARAIENTCYVLAPAQTGTHGEKRQTYGHSMIIDPWGNILAKVDTEIGITMAEIKPDRLQEVRQHIPSLMHRKIGDGLETFSKN